MSKYTQEEIQERLYRHFQDTTNESKVKTITKDNDFKVKTKYKMKNKKIYHEEEKVLLTMLNSYISTQDEVNQIKKLIEDNYTFTSSIKQVIKGYDRKDKLSKIKELCKLQDERFNDLQEAYERLV